MTYTPFTQAEALNAVDVVAEALDDPAVFRATLESPGMVQRVEGAVAVLADYVSNARVLSVARGGAKQQRAASGAFGRSPFNRALR